ncbi:MAG TPA: NRDE family protein, partial [Thermoanaerobaculia bacterium]|nr:NRDE family protein [Thermoanaerobaculia bacterium]
CLVAFPGGPRPHLPLLVAANRDEFLKRPTARAAFWPEAPGLLAGRDLEAGGTWLGATRSGRVAFLTNHRDPRTHREGAPSRGALVVEFLKGEERPGDFLGRKEKEGPRFNGFHLVVCDLSELWYFTNTGGRPQPLAPGIHGLSNGPLDDPWPKTRRTVEGLTRLLAKPGPPRPSSFFELLGDRSRVPDDELPSTGVPLEWERLLSSPFIAAEEHGYGTRSSTVLIAAPGSLRFVERTFAAGRPAPPDVDVSFELAQKSELS